jgi:NADH-quinone oxidoreductase subunit C
VSEVLVEGAVVDESFGQVTVDVDSDRWLEAATSLRDRGFDFFDWLSAYDDTEAGLAVVLHVWSTKAMLSRKLRTRVPRDGGSLPTLTGLWSGADWHERETYEMFAVAFDGHPNLVPLLLPDGFEGNPLRKEFVLASRVAKAWPGEKEPGESDAELAAAAGRERRRKILPPGVPEPGTWGPDKEPSTKRAAESDAESDAATDTHPDPEPGIES